MKKFSKWVRWEDRKDLEGVKRKLPGVYMLAMTSENITGQDFKFREEIVYVGMTNSQSGLKGRLKQFDNTIRHKEGHGGGQRFRNDYRNYKQILKELFVSVGYYKCDVAAKEPKDLLVMGKVAKLEYECFAKYKEMFGELPKFNKQDSPKWFPNKD